MGGAYGMYWGREGHARIWWGSRTGQSVWIKKMRVWEDNIKMDLQETG